MLSESVHQQLPPDVAQLIQKIKLKTLGKKNDSLLIAAPEQQQDLDSGKSAVMYGSSEEDQAFGGEQSSSSQTSPTRVLASSSRQKQMRSTTHHGSRGAFVSNSQQHIWHSSNRSKTDITPTQMSLSKTGFKSGFPQNQGGRSASQLSRPGNTYTATGFKLALNNASVDTINSENSKQSNAVASSIFGKRTPTRVSFKSELEFFLHYMWSQKGFQAEDKTDEYQNLLNQQSTLTFVDNPRMQSTAHRANHFNRTGETYFYRQEKPEYTNRVPISFNFQIPQTQVFTEGKLKRWYHSNELGQIKIYNLHKKPWTEILEKDDQEDSLLVPSMVVYRNPTEEIQAMKGDVQDGRQPCQNEQQILLKDYMSHSRATQLAKSVNDLGSFPQDFNLAQEMVESANLKPAASTSTPGQEPFCNVSSCHEVYEVQWSRGDSMKIFRLRNILQRKKMHIANSKSQMTHQLKPIRQKHGMPNPAKAAKLKLSMPQQLLYLSCERQQNFVDRIQIYPSQLHGRHSIVALDPKLPTPLLPAHHHMSNAHPKTMLESARTSFSAGTTQSNFNSPKHHQLMQEKLEISQTAEELERECQVAFKLIKAQFMLHQLKLEGGTFYFQWVHQEKEVTRDPMKEVEKRLYLTYVKDLQVRDKEKSKVFLPRRIVSQSKDPLTAHFYQLVWAHAELKTKERRHTDVCSCMIQIDQQPQIKRFIQTIFAKLSHKHPDRDHLKYLDQTILNALEFLLDITEALRVNKAAKKKEIQAQIKNKSERNQDCFLNYSSQPKTSSSESQQIKSKCVFCDFSLDLQREKFSLPFAHLIYMPQQEQFLANLGETLPYAAKEKLLLSNQDLPPFLRLLIPNVTSLDQFRELQQDQNWLDQEVSLSKKCYKHLSKFMIQMAQQSERLEPVQNEFQQSMLNLLRKKKVGLNNPMSKAFSMPRLHSPKVDKAFNDNEDRNIDSLYKNQLSYQQMTTKSAHKESDSRNQSRAQSQTKKVRQKSSGAAVNKRELYVQAQSLGIAVMSSSGSRKLSKQEILQQIQAKQASEGIAIKRVKIVKKAIEVEQIPESEDEFMQLMDKVRGSQQGHQDVVMKIRKSRQDSKHMSRRENRSSVHFQDKYRLQSQSQLLNYQHISTKRNSHDSNASSSHAQTSSNHNKGHISSVKSQLARITNEKKQQAHAVQGIRHKSIDRDKLIGKIVGTRVDSSLTKIQKAQKQRRLLNQMEESGDRTFEVCCQAVLTGNKNQNQSLEQSLRNQINQPLFGKETNVDFKAHQNVLDSIEHNNAAKESIKGASVPMSRNRNNLKRSVGELQTLPTLQQSKIFDDLADKKNNVNNKTSDSNTAPKKLSRQRTEKVISKKVKTDHEDSNIIIKLLEKHVPDFKARQEQKKQQNSDIKSSSHVNVASYDPNLSSQSVIGVNQSNSQVNKEIDEKTIKLRRQKLAKKIKKLKQVQMDRNLEALDVHLKSSAKRRLTLRELNCLDPQRSSNDTNLNKVFPLQFGSAAGTAGAKVESPTQEMVSQRMPDLVQAKSHQQFELSRLIQDPIFGQINQTKILNADKIIVNKRILDDPQYKASMQHYRKKVKNPITDDEFELRREHMRVRECENLLKKMGQTLSDHKLCKPAQIASHREFNLTTRLDYQPHQINRLPQKKTNKKCGKNLHKRKLSTPAELKDQAYQALSMIELLRNRENEIAIEERNFKERQISDRVTFIPPEAKLQHTPKVGPDGHFISIKDTASQRQPWVFNAKPTDSETTALHGIQQQRTIIQANSGFIDPRATKMILLQHASSEQDAQNQLTVGDSMQQLSVIDRNIDIAGGIIGRAKSQKNRYSKKGVKNGAVYRDIRGKTVRLGSGDGEVIARSQRQATFVNAARKQQNISLRDLFS